MSCGRTSRKRHRLRSQRNVASATSVTSTAPEPRDIELLRWAKKNGIACRQLRPCTFADTGRGMLARRRVGSGDCVVSVPVHMLITTHTVRSSDFWARALAKCPQASKMAPRQMLSIFLLREKYLGQKSFWYPYICTLPADFSTPSYFTAHESSWLPSSCRRKLNAVRASLYEQYSELRGLLGEMDAELAARFPFEEFRWAS